MATTGPNLRVRISADIADIKSGLGLLRGEIAKVKAEAAKASPDTSAWSSGIGRIRQELGNLAGAYIGIQTVTGAIHALFDAVDRMDRIDELSQIAGVSANAMAKLGYAAKFGAVDVEMLAKGMGKLSKDIAGGKGSLQTLGIQAASADEAMLKLADVFAKMPDGMKKSAAAAKIFGDRMGPGLIPFLNLGRKGLEDLGIEAEKTGNALGDEAYAAAGRFNDALDKLKFQAMGLANETANNLLPALTGFAESAGDAGNQSNFAAEGGKFLATVLKVVVAGAILAKNTVEGLTNVVAFLGDVAMATSKFMVSGLANSLGLVAGTAKDLLSGKNPIEVFTNFLVRNAKAATEMKSSAAGLYSTVRDGYKSMRDGIVDAGTDLGEGIAKLFGDTGDAAESAGKKGKSAAGDFDNLLDGDKKDGKKKQVGELAKSTVLLQDEVKRAIELLDQQFDDIKDQDKTAADISAYYTRRVQLQQELIDLQIEQAQAELAITKELGARRKLEEQITILQRDRAQAGAEGARAQEKAEEELSKTRADALRDRYSNLTGNLSAVEGSISAQIEAGALGMGEGERRLQQVRSKTLEQLRALRVEQAAYLAPLSPASPEYVGAQQSLLGIDTAIANVIASMQQFRQDAEDTLAGALRNVFDNIKEGAMSALNVVRTLIADIADGLFNTAAKSLSKRAASGIANLFGKTADKSADIAAETAGATAAAAIQTTAATSSATILTAGATAAGAALITSATTAAAIMRAASAFGSFGAAHGGGIAGQLRMVRNNINPMVFGAAPRYHGGGIAGLRNDEIPAILQRGEVIRTQQQERALQARMQGGQGGGTPIRNIIVFSEDELAAALEGAAGEKVVINHARRNRGAIGG